MLISLHVTFVGRQADCYASPKNRAEKLSLLKEVPYVIVFISLECKDLINELAQFSSHISS